MNESALKSDCKNPLPPPTFLTFFISFRWPSAKECSSDKPVTSHWRRRLLSLDGQLRIYSVSRVPRLWRGRSSGEEEGKEEERSGEGVLDGGEQGEEEDLSSVFL